MNVTHRHSLCFGEINVSAYLKILTGPLGQAKRDGRCFGEIKCLSTFDVFKNVPTPSTDKISHIILRSSYFYFGSTKC